MDERCPACGKLCYRSYGEALLVQKKIKKRLRRRRGAPEGIYECPDNKRTWHLTHN